MGLLGMVASGFGFLGIGLRQAFLTLQSHQRVTRRNSSLKRLPFNPTDLSIIASLAFLHVVSGLVASHSEQSIADGVGMAVPLERSGVALVFLVYAITAMICAKTSLLPLPWEALQLIAAIAFGQEFLLFYLQRSDAGLESRYYSLLLVPIGTCLLSTLLEIAYPFSVLPPLARSMALVLQGTWFFQMAVSFFSTTFISKGCVLITKGEGDYTIACDGMASMRGKAIATLQFNCHMALLLVTMLPLVSIFCRKQSATLNYRELNYERLVNGESVELKDAVDRSSGIQQSTFVLEQDEEDVHEDGRPEANGFHSVVI